jgi:hypothetical protein
MTELMLTDHVETILKPKLTNLEQQKTLQVNKILGTSIGIKTGEYEEIISKCAKIDLNKLDKLMPHNIEMINTKLGLSERAVTGEITHTEECKKNTDRNYNTCFKIFDYEVAPNHRRDTYCILSTEESTQIRWAYYLETDEGYAANAIKQTPLKLYEELIPEEHAQKIVEVKHLFDRIYILDAETHPFYNSDITEYLKQQWISNKSQTHLPTGAFGVESLGEFETIEEWTKNLQKTITTLIADVRKLARQTPLSEQDRHHISRVKQYLKNITETIDNYCLTTTQKSEVKRLFGWVETNYTQTYFSQELDLCREIIKQEIGKLESILTDIDKKIEVRNIEWVESEKLEQQIQARIDQLVDPVAIGVKNINGKDHTFYITGWLENVDDLALLSIIEEVK